MQLDSDDETFLERYTKVPSDFSAAARVFSGQTSDCKVVTSLQSDRIGHKIRPRPVKVLANYRVGAFENGQNTVQVVQIHPQCISREGPKKKQT